MRRPLRCLVAYLWQQNEIPAQLMPQNQKICTGDQNVTERMMPVMMARHARATVANKWGCEYDDSIQLLDPNSCLAHAALAFVRAAASCLAWRFAGPETHASQPCRQKMRAPNKQQREADRPRPGPAGRTPARKGPNVTSPYRRGASENQKAKGKQEYCKVFAVS